MLIAKGFTMLSSLSLENNLCKRKLCFLGVDDIYCKNSQFYCVKHFIKKIIRYLVGYSYLKEYDQIFN